LKSLAHVTGFTLVETVATLSIVALIAAGMVSLSAFLAEKEHAETTRDHLNELRRAIAGNPVIVVNEARTSFGYLGDMGTLPASLEDLWVKGSQPGYTFSTAKKAGAGWNGPYLEITPAEFSSAPMRDGWGNSLQYSTSASVDDSVGAVALARLLSLGPDLAAGTADDVKLNFFESETVSRVQGFVKDVNDNGVSGVALTLNYPQNGALATQLVNTDASGYYSASNVPFGNRSITMEPMLVLAAGSTVVSGASDQHVKFTVKNYAAANIGVTSLSLTYTIEPNAWFGQIRVDGTTVFDSSSPRFGSGDTVSFAQKTAKGTGLNAESIPIRIQSPITDVADLTIGKVGAGGSLIIEFRAFNDVESGGGGSAVDVSGVNFEVTLRNSFNEVIGVVAVTP
jgi:hypothetical protein